MNDVIVKEKIIIENLIAVLELTLCTTKRH